MNRLVLLAVVLAACRAPQTFDGMSLYRSGRMHELRDRLRGERTASPDVAARNAILLARTYIDLRVVWDEGSFDDALAALAPARPSDPRLVGELEQAHGEVMFWRLLAGGQGTWDDVRARFERALALRTTARDTRGIAESTFYRGLIAQFTGTPAEARGYFERAVAIGREVDDPLLRSYPIRHLADLAETAGDLERAGALHREALVLRERAGDVLRLFNARITLATFQCERMRACDAARPQIEAAERTAETLRMPHGAVEVALLRAQLAEWQGDLAARDAAWDRTLALATKAGDADIVAAVHLARAAARLRSRDLAGAIADARAANTPDAHAIIVEAALRTNDVDTASAALATAWADRPAQPSARRYLAAAAWIEARGANDALAATGLPLDASAWRVAALEAAERDHDVRAKLDVLVAQGRLDEARQLAAGAHLPVPIR